MARNDFELRYGWQFKSGTPEIPDEWLPLLIPLCELINDTVHKDRRDDFQMDVYCDRGDYPMSVNILMEPSDIDMDMIEALASEAEESVRVYVRNH